MHHSHHSHRLFNSLISIYLREIGVQTSDPNQTQSEQYKQMVIIAVCGIPGSLLATVLVELPYAGRKGSMAGFMALTGVFLFGFTTAKSSSAVLGWNCGVSVGETGRRLLLLLRR